MSGKGKGKKKRTGFSYKHVDLTRFAYDVIRYTALKFRVPESAIAVMEGSSNDYGHDDYLSVVCAQVIDSQIMLRNRVNMTFREHFKINTLASPELIGKLMQEVMDMIIRELELGFMDVVVASLATIGELFLFLYSENTDLGPIGLATIWIQSYLNLNKKKFVDTGGLKELYNHSRRNNLEHMDVFLNSFIDEHCVSYENSSKIESLQVTYMRKLSKEISREFLSSDEDEKEIEPANLNNQILHLNIEDAVVVPQPDRASGSNAPQDAGLGIIPPNKVLNLPSPSVESSENPSAATPEEQQRYRRYLTPNERKEKLNSRLRAIIQRGLGQPSSDSSEKTQSNVSVLEGTAPSYRLHGDRPKMHGESSSQRDMPCPCPNVEQGSGKSSSDSSGAEQSRK